MKGKRNSTHLSSHNWNCFVFLHCQFLFTLYGSYSIFTAPLIQLAINLFKWSYATGLSTETKTRIQNMVKFHASATKNHSTGALGE
jgi:hypothetical protein